MQHMPLARRYRPQKFSDVMGQEQAVSALINALTRQKTSCAYLFCGTRGSGKTTLARLLAKAVNCEQLSPQGESCSTCNSCRMMSTGSHLDVIEIDGASHRGIDDIRQIKEAVGFQPSLGRFKVYIIDEVHMLTKEAFNALLKTLEEPPATVKFILATTEAHKVPATILSRCQRFQLRRIPPLIIQELLSRVLHNEAIPFEEAALVELSQRADGSVRDSLSLLDQLLAFEPSGITYQGLASMLGLTSQALLEEYEQAIATGQSAAILQIVQKVIESGVEPTYFIEQLQEHYRLLLGVVCGATPGELLGKEKLFYEQLKLQYSESHILYILDFLQESLGKSKWTQQPRLHLEMTLLQLGRKPWLFSLDNLLQRLHLLESRLVQAAGGSTPATTTLAVAKEPGAPALVATSSLHRPSSLPNESSSTSGTSTINPPTKPTNTPPSSNPSSTLTDKRPAAATSSPHAVAAPLKKPTANTSPVVATPNPVPSTTPPLETLAPGRYDGLVQFAAKELGGHLR